MNDKKDILDKGPFYHGTKAELVPIKLPRQISRQT